jgi:F0F1-type ATP synthase membrane subunit b/b'
MEEHLAIASSSSILKSAKDEAQTIINTASSEANAQKTILLEQAKLDLSINYQNSLKQMEEEKNQVLLEMDSIVNEISLAMTTKLLEEIGTSKKVIGV